MSSTQSSLSLVASPLVKVPLLICAARLGFAGFTPPTAPAKAEEQKKYTAAGTDPMVSQTAQVKVIRVQKVRSILPLPRLSDAERRMQVCVWAMILCEGAVLGALHFPSEISTRILESLALRGAANITFTPATVAGMVLLAIGGSIRLSCYRTLGKHFTWDLTVHKNHTLITSGLYSVVRHPAYIGSMTIFAGFTLALFGQGSWFAECIGWDTTVGRVVGGAWTSYVMIAVNGLVRRPAREDAVLQQEFGKEWEAYAKKVPYRLIPYIY